jgi:hypothetical protein
MKSNTERLEELRTILRRFIIGSERIDADAETGWEQLRQMAEMYLAEIREERKQ